MSQRQYKVKCFSTQSKGRAKRKHEGVALRHLWFKGDRCAPSDLLTKELKRRLKWHMAELGGLVPSSGEYAMHLALAHLYEALLQSRKMITVKIKIAHA